MSQQETTETQRTQRLHREEKNSELKIHLERKLDPARSGTRRRDASKRRWHGDVVVRVREIGPVENVEKLRAKLAAHPFRDRDELDHREVHVLLPRPIKEVARRVSTRV